MMGRGSAGPDLTIRYGEHEDQIADLSFPVGAVGAVALVLLLHGGFWRAAYDRLHVGVVADDLADRGYAVANVEYRRVGAGGGWPVTLTDVAQAADVLPGLVERERPGLIDPGRVVYLGHSAGGHLALWAALRDRLPEGAPGRVPSPPRVAGVVALGAAVNLAEADRLGSGNGAVAAFLGGGPAEVPERFAAADPSALGRPGFPTVLVHGELDEVLPVEMSRAYHAAFGGGLTVPEGADHFDVIDPRSTAWPAVLAALRQAGGSQDAEGVG
ncbi:MAG: alpha/beta hydrolase [Streptosporangiaceae bacterium]